MERLEARTQNAGNLWGCFQYLRRKGYAILNACETTAETTLPGMHVCGVRVLRRWSII